MSAQSLVRIACLLLALLGLASCLRAEESNVLPASAEVPTPTTPITPTGDAAPPAGPRVKFSQRETLVGDRVVQRVGMQLGVRTRIVQSGQIAHDSTSEIRSQQQRTVDVMAVADGRAVKARVAFQTARRQSPDSATPTELAPLPTEGKTYLLTREGEELSVTDAQGLMPPLEEFKLVSEALEGVGKPNPLAMVLGGRELAVGQRVFVPRDMAKELLGLGGPELAEVSRFELTLDRLTAGKTVDEPAVAVFRMMIEVKPEEGAGLAVVLNGEMAVEPVGCRLAAVDLAGPVHVSTIERTDLGIYQYSMDGDLSVAIRSTFGPTAK